VAPNRSRHRTSAYSDTPSAECRLIGASGTATGSTSRVHCGGRVSLAMSAGAIIDHVTIASAGASGNNAAGTVTPTTGQAVEVTGASGTTHGSSASAAASKRREPLLHRSPHLVAVSTRQIGGALLCT
jgi:hypothetical protein